MLTYISYDTYFLGYTLTLQNTIAAEIYETMDDKLW